jgi:hypothetical protein
MAEPSTHINYTFEDIQRYLQGKMSAAEMHALEKAALQDPFLSDAIEGYRETSSVTAQQHLNEINAGLQKKKQDSKVISIKNNNQWLRIVAMVILLAGIGVIGTYFFKKSDKQNQIAQTKNQESEKQNTIEDSVATVKPETSLVNKNTVPVIAQNKKQKKTHPLKKQKPSKPYINADTAKEVETSVASLKINPEKNMEADKAFSPAPLSAQKNNDSTQYLQYKSRGLNVTAANTFAGKVVDKNNKPIAGAFVSANPKSGAVTDLNGNFTLQKNDSLLHVNTTAVGYVNKNVLLKPDDSNLITLEQNQSALSDVVVTGYGVKRKKSDQTATPVGGWQNFNNYVTTKLNEDSTKENYMSDNDIVELEFLIDDDGNPYNIKITKPLDDKRNLKAIDILKSGPRWTHPSKKKKVKVAITF